VYALKVGSATAGSGSTAKHTAVVGDVLVQRPSGLDGLHGAVVDVQVGQAVLHRRCSTSSDDTTAMAQNRADTAPDLRSAMAARLSNDGGEPGRGTSIDRVFVYAARPGPRTRHR
jgi:hypothetical protein